MKKYEMPEIEIEMFTVENILTDVSGAPSNGDDDMGWG